MKKIIIAAIILPILVIGCKSTIIDRMQLAKEIDAMHANTMHRGVFYAGSDDKFHYINVKWDMKKDIAYRVPVSEVSINNKMEPNRDKSKWRLLISDITSNTPVKYELLFKEDKKYYYIEKAPNNSL